MTDDPAHPVRSFHCPVCGAAQKIPDEQEEPACRRCRADLAAWLQTRRSIAMHALLTLAAIRRDDHTSAG